MNGYKVRQNKEEGKDVPCIRVSNGKTRFYAKRVKFLGPTEIIQCTFDPNEPNKPFIWIETDGPLEFE